MLTEKSMPVMEVKHLLMRQTATRILHMGRVNFAKHYPGFSLLIHLTPFKELFPFFPFACELLTGTITSYGDLILT